MAFSNILSFFLELLQVIYGYFTSVAMYCQSLWSGQPRDQTSDHKRSVNHVTDTSDFKRDVLRNRRKSIRRTLDHNSSIDHVDTEMLYKLRNPYCLIIVNTNFQEMFTPRLGAEADLKNIETLLKESAGFHDIHIYKDVKRLELLQMIEEIATSNTMKNHDGFLCFISSHGTGQGICMYDRKSYVKVEELTSRLNGVKCMNLRGKPKLFFIQACRGTKTDKGVTDPKFFPDSDNDNDVKPKLPSEADFMVSYSTTPHSISYRRFCPENDENDTGSWFIHHITEIFTKYMQKEDIMQMMTRVNHGVSQMATGDDHTDGEKQIPVTMFMLRKRLFFGNS